jgi:hypothetical protein
MKNLTDQTYNTGDEWPSEGILSVPYSYIECAAGWNLIGGYENNVSISDITTIPPGIQQSPIYGYEGGYQVVNYLIPGYGYWIKLSMPGVIFLQGGLTKGKGSANKTEYFRNNWGKIILTDSRSRSYTLYAVNGEVDLDKYELPPLPPDGIFDVRFSSGRIAEEINNSEKTIDLNGIEYPLTVEIQGMNATLQDVTRKSINAYLKSGDEVVVSDKAIKKLIISGEIVPWIFSLEQNYPNPFNPKTVINYQLPVSGDVVLTVFDILGNKVETLVDEYKPAGKYEVKFQATNLSSGVYFYQLRAGSFVETKKMILLK